MADSTVADISKMKVVDLRKELKSRGLLSTGDKSELVARLQTAIAQDATDIHADITLDSDEIDSDGVLDEDDKNHADILDDTDTLNEEEALAEHPPSESAPKPAEVKTQRILKRKITINDDKEKKSDSKTEESKEIATKKIVLNRAISMTSTTKPAEETDDKPSKTEELATETKKVKITAELDTKTKLELRAKRFGLPVKMTDDQRKEARKDRFGQNSGNTKSASSSISTFSNPTSSENLEKLKKRAERFGQSVSKFMTAVETTEKLEKRKAKFGTVK